MGWFKESSTIHNQWVHIILILIMIWYLQYLIYYFRVTSAARVTGDWYVSASTALEKASPLDTTIVLLPWLTVSSNKKDHNSRDIKKRIRMPLKSIPPKVEISPPLIFVIVKTDSFFTCHRWYISICPSGAASYTIAIYNHGCIKGYYNSCNASHTFKPIGLVSASTSIESAGSITYMFWYATGKQTSKCH